MSNISIYHNSVLDGATVTATGIADGSSASYVRDNLLSFKFATEGTTTTFEIEQPVASGVSGLKSWEYLVLSDHNLAGASFTLDTWEDSGRSSGAVRVFDDNIPNEDPFIFQNSTGLLRTGDGSLQLTMVASGSNTQSIGELMLVPKFDSPRSPLVSVPANTQLRRTFIDLPNGERRSIQHAQPARKKSYQISGLTQAQAQLWKAEFELNEGIRLIALTDDEGETYMVLWNTSLASSRELDIFSVNLEFMEIRL